jgi:hypothetical protein
MNWFLPKQPRPPARTRPGVRWLAAALFGVALVATAAAEETPTPSAGEWQIKSVFLYNFTKFVEWPAASFAGSSQAIVIGVLGAQPLVQEFGALVPGRSVNGRPIQVRTVRTVEEVRATQLLFVTAAEEARFRTMRTQLLDSPVLTVGESPSFSATGAIGFVQEGTRLRFEINMDVAERAHLKISSQLQKLAAAVRRVE